MRLMTTLSHVSKYPLLASAAHQIKCNYVSMLANACKQSAWAAAALLEFGHMLDPVSDRSHRHALICVTRKPEIENDLPIMLEISTRPYYALMFDISSNCTTSPLLFYAN